MCAFPLHAGIYDRIGVGRFDRMGVVPLDYDEGKTPMAPKRKYAMTRIRSGDYLLPSNDGSTLWRIYSYEEYGDAQWQDGDGKWHKVTGTFWASAKYERPFHDQGEHTDPDFLEWDQWLTWETNLPTRKAAIESALSAGVVA